MKRYFILMILALSLSNPIFAASALTCNDIVGIWNGTLQGNFTFSPFKLTIEDTGNNSPEDATVSFVVSDGTDLDYGMLQGSCSVEKNGTVTMTLTRNSDGIGSGFTLHLLDNNHLATSFSYSDDMDNYNGSGILSR